MAEEARRKADVAGVQAVHPVEEDEPDAVETCWWRYRHGKQGHGKRKATPSVPPMPPIAAPGTHKSGLVARGLVPAVRCDQEAVP